MKCPFCNEDDFDPIGLKYHLIHHCDNYALVDISSVHSLFAPVASQQGNAADGKPLVSSGVIRKEL